MTGSVVTLGVTSLTATTPAVAFGAGAYTLGAGATAVALEGEIAIAIGSGASAATIGGSYSRCHSSCRGRRFECGSTDWTSELPCMEVCNYFCKVKGKKD